MEDNEKLKALHESLLKDNYELPSYEVFAEDLRSPEKSKAFYDGLAKDNYELPDYEVFVNDLGLKKKVSPADYGLPSKEVFAEMFGNISKPEVSERPPDPYDAEKFATPDLSLESSELKGPDLNSSIGTFPAYRRGPDVSLQTPELDGPQLETVGDTVAKYLSGERITSWEHKKNSEERIGEIDARLKELPKAQMQTGDVSFGADVTLNTTPEQEEKLRLQEERKILTEAITSPTKAQYLFGKAYSQSLMGIASKLAIGSDLASPEWLEKYDAGTLTDAAATAMGFMLDMPFFGVAGKVGGAIGKAAAKPIVNRVMTNSVKKFMAAGIEESLAKKLALNAAVKVSQGIAGMTSSGVALGSYGFVGSALGDWAQPDANFDDIKWSNAFKRGGKDFLLGTGVGGLGIGSAVLASQASAIPNLAGRVGGKVGAGVGGLTAESALFTYGGALLEGRSPNEVTGKEFLDTVALIGMLKASHVVGKIPEKIANPKKAAVDLYKSLQYDPKKPGYGQFSVDIEPWEIQSLDFADARNYKEAMEVLAKDDGKLAEIMKDESIPALLKQKILWGARGVAINDININADKVIPNEDYVELYNANGVLVDKWKFSSKEEANQVALDKGLQLEDNKMQQRSAEPDVDRVKIVADLKSEGEDIPALQAALDKPVADRTLEENKKVGKYAKKIPAPKKEKGKTAEKKPEAETESKLAVGEKQFKTKEELNTYLEDIAVNKKTGEVDETWFDREVNAWPTPETVKAINEWTENKKAEIKAKRKPEKEEPIETGLNKVEPKELDKNGLIDEVRRFSILSASGKKKAAVQANHIRVNAKRLGYELKEGEEWKAGIIKDGKFLGIRKDPAKPDKQKAEASKLLTERDKDFQDYMNDVLETNPNLFGVLIGGITNEQRAQAVKDIKAGKKSVASATALDALEYMYKDHGGIDIWNAEGETRVRVSRDEIRAEVEDMRRRKRDELFNTYNLDEALEKGLITKTEYDEIRESERKQDIESRAAEEDFYRDETGDIEGGKEKGTEGELTPKVNEQPVKQPDITTGKEGENLIPAGTEKDVTGVEGQGTKEPVSEPAKVETPQPQGIKFKDKNYTDIEQVQDDLASGKITFDESKKLMEDVRKFEDNLKAEAEKQAEKSGERMNLVSDEAEQRMLDEFNPDKGKLYSRLIPPIIERGSTALWNQLRHIRDGMANSIAKSVGKGLKNQNDLLRWHTKALTNLYNGLARTQAEMHGRKKGDVGKLAMTGTVKVYAPHEGAELYGKLKELVHGDYESLERVWSILDPEMVVKEGEKPLTYGDLSLAEKNLYNTAREWINWGHETNYAAGFLPTETYLKNKDATGYSTYIARMYDTHEVDMTMEGLSKQGKGSVSIRLITDYMKARKEIDGWKQEHAIKDPAYLVAKRVMQTIQNVAVKRYQDLIIREHPDYVIRVKKGQDVPKGYTQLGGSYAWGQFRNKAVIDHIVEDFTGYYFANHRINMMYDLIKSVDQSTFNQFYKKYRTVFNPFVQTGNIAGNFFLGSINGINPVNLAAKMIKYRNLHETNPVIFKSLLKSGLIGDFAITSDFRPLVKGEISAKDNPSGILDLLKKGDEFATKLYTGADNTAKIAAYMIYREHGLSHELAVRRAYDAFQNYATVGKTWDFFSKIPAIGPTFVKFQADLQRILINNMLTTPLTTIGTVALIKLFGDLTSRLSGETDEEKEIREGRKGVPKIPIANIPLSFRMGDSEVNFAKYLTPFYLYPQGDSQMDIYDFSKFTPLQLQKPKGGSEIPLPAFADATWGWLGAVAADRDFRNISIQDPLKSPYTDVNISGWERLSNILHYVARSQVPFYRGTEDIIKGATGQLDYYGRKRDWKQAILNNIVKVQQFGDTELKNYMERQIEYLTQRFANLSENMGDANSQFLKAMKKAEDMGIEGEALQNLYEKEDKLRNQRMQKSLDEQVPVMDELERITKVYKGWDPNSKFIQENFLDIEAGKNRRFNVQSDVDLQKQYPYEYKLLKKNNLLKTPRDVPKYINGTKLTDEQRKLYVSTYWKEYIQFFDDQVGLTEEEFEKARAFIVGKEQTTKSPNLEDITSLQKMSEIAYTYAVGRATQDLMIRMNQTK